MPLSAVKALRHWQKVLTRTHSVVESPVSGDCSKENYQKPSPICRPGSILTDPAPPNGCRLPNSPMRSAAPIWRNGQDPGKGGGFTDGGQRPNSTTSKRYRIATCSPATKRGDPIQERHRARTSRFSASSCSTWTCRTTPGCADHPRGFTPRAVVDACMTSSGARPEDRRGRWPPRVSGDLSSRFPRAPLQATAASKVPQEDRGKLFHWSKRDDRATRSEYARYRSEGVPAADDMRRWPRR